MSSLMEKATEMETSSEKSTQTETSTELTVQDSQSSNNSIDILNCETQRDSSPATSPSVIVCTPEPNEPKMLEKMDEVDVEMDRPERPKAPRTLHEFIDLVEGGNISGESECRSTSTSDDEDNNKENIPPTPATSPVEAAPETPSILKRQLVVPATPKRPQPYSKLMRKCLCRHLCKEHQLNLRPAHVFESQLKHMEFHEDRPRLLGLGEILLLSEFKVGLTMKVKIVLFKSEMLIAPCSERVVIVLEDGHNEVMMFAHDFLKYDFQTLNETMTSFVTDDEVEHSASPLDDDIPHEVELTSPTNVTASFTKEKQSYYLVLTSTHRGFDAEKIHISSYTWVELKGLHPLLAMTTENYLNLCMQGRSVEGIPPAAKIFSDDSFSPKTQMTDSE